MTPQQKSLVRQTLTRLAGRSAQAGLFFYDRLFALDPSLRAMFHGDLQTQGQKFMDTLSGIVHALDSEAAVAVDLRHLGRRHRDYGVQWRHYGTMREALLWSLAQILGNDFDDETAAAWCAAYGIAVRAMQEAPVGTAERL